MASLARVAFVSALMLAATPLAQARDSSTTINFARGASQASVSGSITGNDTASFLVSARSGQTMQLTFSPSNPSCFVSVYAPNDRNPIYDGSEDGSDSYAAALPTDGTYRLQAYLNSNEARRGSTCRFTMTIGLNGGGRGGNQGASDDEMRRECQNEVADQYDVKPSKIALERDVKQIRGGYSLGGTADKGRNGGIQSFKCLFDTDRKFSSIQGSETGQNQGGNYALPAGGWSQSCKNASVDRNGIMYAQCTDIKGRSRDAQLDIRKCKSAENVNGTLVCTQQQ